MRARYAANPEPVKARVRDYHRRNPDKLKEGNLRKKAGVSLEWFRAQALKQDGLCAICGKPETAIMRGKPVALAADHSHETGAPRALLCMKCNRALGLVGESRETLQKMIDYLKFHSEGNHA